MTDEALRERTIRAMERAYLDLCGLERHDSALLFDVLADAVLAEIRKDHRLVPVGEGEAIERAVDRVMATVPGILTQKEAYSVVRAAWNGGAS